MNKIELDRIHPADMVVQRGFGLVEERGLREFFACYIVDPSQSPNWAEIEAARGHPKVTALFAKANKLAEKITNKACATAAAKLGERLTQ